MQSTLTIQVAIWAVMAAVLGALALYRKFVAREEVDVIHLRDAESRIISQQETFAQKLSGIDRWGKILTIVLVVYGLIIASVYLFFAWKQSVQISG